MADEKKFALPDSMQFRASYSQKRRRSRNNNVVEWMQTPPTLVNPLVVSDYDFDSVSLSHSENYSVFMNHNSL